MCASVLPAGAVTSWDFSHVFFFFLHFFFSSAFGNKAWRKEISETDGVDLARARRKASWFWSPSPKAVRRASWAHRWGWWSSPACGPSDKLRSRRTLRNAHTVCLSQLQVLKKKKMTYEMLAPVCAVELSESSLALWLYTSTDRQTSYLPPRETLPHPPAPGPLTSCSVHPSPTTASIPPLANSTYQSSWSFPRWRLT